MAQARLTQTDYSSTWPEYLRKAKLASKLDPNAEKPILIDMGTTGAQKELKSLIAESYITEVIDDYDEQLGELFISENAHLYRANLDVKRTSIRDYLKDHYGKTEPWQMGGWAYFPWNGQLIHILAPELFWKLRTIRNRDLISEKEQLLYRKYRCGCLGMSVGSSGALALALQGGSEEIKLADGGVISGSNLNRILTGVTSVGKEKSLVIAQHIYEMNPYQKVSRLKKKLDKKNIVDFFQDPWPIDLVVDEMDDLEMKIRVRIEARSRKLPVIMATELGDHVMLDVERFDQEPDAQLFHGLVGNIEEILERTDISQRQWLKYATDIIGLKNVPVRMQQSLLKVGSTLPTHPQLGGTSMMAGAVNAYAARLLALGEPIKSGRHILSMDDAFLAGHTSYTSRRKHRQHTKVLKNALNSMTKS